MKYIKMALISFVVFFCMFTVVGLLFPSSITSVNAVVIEKRKEIVLKELQISHRWTNWYPFFQTSMGEKVINAEKDSTIFFNDRKEILIFDKVADSNSISFSADYHNGSITRQTAKVLDITEDSSRVQLVWSETEKLKWYPWERFRGLVLEKAKKEYLDEILGRFKQYIDTLSTH